MSLSNDVSPALGDRPCPRLDLQSWQRPGSIHPRVQKDAGCEMQSGQLIFFGMNTRDLRPASSAWWLLTELSVPSVSQDHCYYHGHVRGYRSSWIVLSTCSGIRYGACRGVLGC